MANIECVDDRVIKRRICLLLIIAAGLLNTAKGMASSGSYDYGNVSIIRHRDALGGGTLETSGLADTVLGEIGATVIATSESAAGTGFRGGYLGGFPPIFPLIDIRIGENEATVVSVLRWKPDSELRTPVTVTVEVLTGGGPTVISTTPGHPGDEIRNSCYDPLIEFIGGEAQQLFCAARGSEAYAYLLLSFGDPPNNPDELYFNDPHSSEIGSGIQIFHDWCDPQPGFGGACTFRLEAGARATGAGAAAQAAMHIRILSIEGS